MNKERIFDLVQNVFHWETITVSPDGNSAELSTSYWPIQGVVEVEIKSGAVRIYNKQAFAGADIHSYDSTEEVSKALVEFIARILLANPSNDNLSFPYNCNLSYIPYIIKELNTDVEVANSRSIKSAADTDLNYMDPGYFRWEDGVVYDKDNIHWDFNDYVNGYAEPYATYMDAVKATADAVEDSYTKDEIAEPWEYAEYLVTYALEQLPDPGKFCKEYEGL